MASGIGGALSGALGGVMGPLTQLPQQAMQAGQGAMQPLMSAMQQAQGADGLAAVDGARLLDSIGASPVLAAVQVAVTSGAGALAALPPPAIWVHHPYRRRHRRRLPRGHRPSRRRCPRPAALHLPQRTWVRPGCRWCRRARWAPGAKGAAKKSRSKARDRACGPQWPAGQGPPDGAPSAPTTKPTDGKPVVRRRILLPEHKDFGRIAPDEKTDAGE